MVYGCPGYSVCHNRCSNVIQKVSILTVKQICDKIKSFRYAMGLYDLEGSVDADKTCPTSISNNKCEIF